MKTFDYIKNIIKVIIWPILFGIGQFFVILIFTFSFNNNIYNNLVNDNNSLNIEKINEMFNLYTSSEEYKILLTNYINDNTIWIILIVALIFIPILLYKYKKIKPNFNFKVDKNILHVILVGFCISIIFNLIIININKILNIENSLLDSKYLIVTILSSGIIGPIIEELLFRGIMFNKLKLFNKMDVSILLSTLIFTFFHDTLNQMIFAFIIGYLNIKFYIKYDTLLFPIIFHISCNIVVPVLNNFLIDLNHIYSIIIIIVLSILLIIFCKKKYIKK